ncbi:MAG: nucleotidyltransferase domain-containing protein [Deltaproteobacteria bacterium]|nr:nucleotidyltransferase domain-containing protein [Deltaproteobacteria bacterium]
MVLDVTSLQQLARGYPDARLIVLFGSVARGAAHPGSDVDVAVAGLPFWQALDLGARLGAQLGREPHVVELERASDWLRFLVARDGVLLHQGEPHAWARFQAEAALRWFDLAPIVARCAEGARRALRETRADG